jgi:NACalpha-BTF3-like transcription factor
MTEAIVDDALETLPIRAAQRIVQHIHEQLGIEHVTVDKVFTILERVLGEEFIAKNAQVRETARKLDINNRMDFEYSDKPEPLVLTNLAQQKLETPKEIHGEKSTDQILEDYIRDLVTKESKQSGKSKRFDKSRREYSNRLRSQHQLLQMFPDSSRQGKKLDANDHEMDVRYL